MKQTKQSLPIDDRLPDIESALENASGLVVIAEPGAGKTTRVPPWLVAHREHLNINGRVLVLQPRRVAVRGSVERISEENGWTIGREIGYQIRFDSVGADRAPLVFMTEGILGQWIIRDPELSGIGAVVLDEFHERSLNLDFAIACLREIQTSLRPDLKIIVMSATLNAQTVSKFLGDVPILSVAGKRFPLEIQHSARPLSLSGGPELIQRTQEAIHSTTLDPADDGGHILVFLPGAGEIRRLISKLEESGRFNSFEIAALHGQTATDEQVRLLKKSAKRRIIVATNIAETSLTLDGVTTVIDSGLARVVRFDSTWGIESLELARISRANADQRAGRAARQSPGRVVRLWTKQEEPSFPEYLPAEISRSDLTDLVLQLMSWGVSDFNKFNWFERPPSAALASALQLLETLGVRDSKTFEFTSIGRMVSRISLPARAARVLVEFSKLGLTDFGAEVAAVLSERDFIYDSFQSDSYRYLDSDLDLRLDLLDSARGISGVDANAIRQIHRLIETVQEQARHLQARHLPARQDQATQNSSVRSKSESKSDSKLARPHADVIAGALLSGYRDRLIRRRPNDTTRGVMTGRRGVVFHPRSICTSAPYSLALSLQGFQMDARIFMATPIRESVIQDILKNEIKEERRIQKTETGKWLELKVSTFRDVEIGNPKESMLTPDELARVLVHHVKSDFWNLAMQNENFASWRTRIEFLKEVRPDLDWLSWSTDDIAQISESWCYQKRTLDEIREENPSTYFEAKWTREQKQMFDREAPRQILVPSGSWIDVQYPKGRPPLVAVRLQEVFGWKESLLLAFGKVKIVMELLGPNYRALQTTQDLSSFWKTVYLEIRPQLRAKYPRHAWPDDPLVAPAVAKGGVKKKKE